MGLDGTAESLYPLLGEMYDKYECIEAIEAMLSHEEFIGYLRGNSLKYRWRFRYKDFIQDLDKATWYEAKLKQVLLNKDRDESS